MPLNLNMGHVENWSQKLVLDVLVAVIVDVPMARDGIETTAPIGPEAATAATAELAAAATKAAPEMINNNNNIKEFIVLFFSFLAHFEISRQIKRSMETSSNYQ